MDLESLQNNGVYPAAGILLANTKYKVVHIHLAYGTSLGWAGQNRVPAGRKGGPDCSTAAQGTGALGEAAGGKFPG